MSGKLDQSLDEILSTQKAAGRRRSARRTTSRPNNAPPGGIQKSTKPARNAAKPAPSKNAGLIGESKIMVSNLVRLYPFSFSFIIYFRKLRLLTPKSPRMSPKARSRYVTDEASSAFGVLSTSIPLGIPIDTTSPIMGLYVRFSRRRSPRMPASPDVKYGSTPSKWSGRVSLESCAKHKSSTDGCLASTYVLILLRRRRADWQHSATG